MKSSASPDGKAAAVVLLLILASSTVASSASTLFSAAQSLSNSGYLSMALTLQLAASAGLDLDFPAATIFAPPDSAFLESGPPSLPLLLFHISPRRLSVNTLPYLRRGTKIHTLLPNRTLTVTSSFASQGFASLDDVRLDTNSVLDDGAVIIYAVERFFNLSFVADDLLFPPPPPPLPVEVQAPPPAPAPVPSPPPVNSSSVGNFPQRPFYSVADSLRSRGCYSIMAAFLDSQLIGFNRKTALTIFAATDEAIEIYAKNASDYSAVFRAHVVPALLTWQDLVALGDGSTLPSFREGFTISVIKTGDVPVLNDVPVADQDLYLSRFVVVHGVNRLLTSEMEKLVEPAVTQEVGAADVTSGEDPAVADVADQGDTLGSDDYH